MRPQCERKQEIRPRTRRFFMSNHPIPLPARKRNTKKYEGGETKNWVYLIHTLRYVVHSAYLNRKLKYIISFVCSISHDQISFAFYRNYQKILNFSSNYELRLHSRNYITSVKAPAFTKRDNKNLCFVTCSWSFSFSSTVLITTSPNFLIKKGSVR